MKLFLVFMAGLMVCGCANSGVNQHIPEGKEVPLGKFEGKVVYEDSDIKVMEGKTEVIIPEFEAVCSEAFIFKYNNGDIMVCSPTNRGKGAYRRSADGGKTWFDIAPATVHEGGSATPLIAHWPAGISGKLNDSLVHEPTHLIDLMPTCVDLSGAKYPQTYKGNKIIPMEGKSLRPIFEAKGFKRNEPIFFEHEGNKAVRKGKWKLVSVKSGK